MMKDVEYKKCEEYSPLNRKANRLGMKVFWRADYKGISIAWGDTKAECVKDVRRYFNRKK